MSQEVKNTQLVETDNGNTYVITDIIGSGAQGGVFKVANNSNLLVKALVTPEGKILLNRKRYDAYFNNIVKVMTTDDSIPYIAKPIATLKAPACGYLMQFLSDMEPIMKDMVPSNGDILGHYISRGGLAKRIKVLLRLAKILKHIHSKGRVYCDLSPNNVFISGKCEPAKVKNTTQGKEYDAIIESSNYETWLIDLDNLKLFKETSCIGTPYYQAPEIVKGKNNSLYSDIYSFALLAFEYLTYSKPFQGELALNGEYEEDAWDETEPEDLPEDNWNSADSFEALVEKGEIPYVYDKEDTSNAPVSGIPLQYVAAEKLQELFCRTFSRKGKSVPESRPRMSEWCDALQDTLLRLTECDYGHTHLGKNCVFCEALKLERICQRNGKFYQLKLYDKYELENEAGEMEVLERLVGLRNIYLAPSIKHDYHIEWSELIPIPEKFDHKETDVAIMIKGNAAKVEMTTLSWDNIRLKPLEENAKYEIIMSNKSADEKIMLITIEEKND